MGSQSWDYFGEANAQYLQVRWSNPEGMPRRELMDQVVSRLRSASRLDRRCPLYHSKLADTLLEAGAEARAKWAYEQSLALCPDWVPAYFGLAAIEIGNRNFDSAIRCLRSAEIAIGEIEARARACHGQDSKNAVRTAATRQEAPDSEAIDLVLGWLAVNEDWLPEDTLRIHQRGRAQGGPDPQMIIDRLQARLHFMVVVLRRARSDNPEDVFNGPLDDSIAADPNFAPARMEQAMLYREMGGLENLIEAERILAAFVKPGNNPAFAGHPRMWYELARTRAALYLSVGDSGWYEQAIQAFDIALRLSGNRGDWNADRIAFVAAAEHRR